jgi:hypothetical protein
MTQTLFSLKSCEKVVRTSAHLSVILEFLKLGAFKFFSLCASDLDLLWRVANMSAVLPNLVKVFFGSSH